jgi:hypothetical protein
MRRVWWLAASDLAPVWRRSVGARP